MECAQRELLNSISRILTRCGNGVPECVYADDRAAEGFMLTRDFRQEDFVEIRRFGDAASGLENKTLCGKLVGF
jgi:hypothetical protein